MRTWLYAILHNLTVSQMRQRARRGSYISVDDAPEANLAVAPSQDDSLLQLDVTAALDALPEEQRGVLLLVSVEELSYAEAAQVLAIPIGTVMSRLSRSRSDDPAHGRRERVRFRQASAAQQGEVTMRPIYEDDLQAFVDGRLEAARTR